MGPALAYLPDFVDDAGEDPAASTYFYAGFDHIFDRGDPHGFTWTRQLHVRRYEPVIFQHKVNDLLFAYIQSTVFYISMICKLDIIDKDFSKFQFHGVIPPLYIYCIETFYDIIIIINKYGVYNRFE